MPARPAKIRAAHKIHNNVIANKESTGSVKDRLTKETNYWDFRANELKEQELAGKVNARINSGKARADELEVRLQKRLAELEQERQFFPLPPPVVVGGALVVPGGLLARLHGTRQAEPALFARETERVEQAAMAAVMETERRLGFDPTDVSAENYGYDVESRVVGTGKLRFIEVKGRIPGAQAVTVTKNEILTALNEPEDFILALVEAPTTGDRALGDVWSVQEPSPPPYGDGCKVRYVRHTFQREPDFGATSVNYSLSELLAKSESQR